VGDSVAHDIAGARQIGMRGVLLVRGTGAVVVDPDVTVIRSLRELPALLSPAAS
jgi:FMN phosphatase YigB (HAD superfamily)